MFQRTRMILAVATLAASAAFAQSTPDALIKSVSDDVLSSVKADKGIQSGDLSRIQALVDSKVLPHVDLQRMTAAVVGKAWRQATPEQQQKLQAQFKTLLIRTYAGALTRVNNDTTVTLKPLRAAPDDSEVTVHTEIRGVGDPVELDYRLEKAADGWKIYDVNVLGAWLVQTYKSSFAQDVNAGGIDNLIAKLAERNKQLAAKKAGS